ncbi:Uncharacterised protein [Capnocytophaga ochracea]|uniref:Uncharacterized protein n=1 Tax=Capnocytophaga ochracea TaxID=1018 RepID=A0A7Z8YBF8_CAPOC|nr:hypothetical protein HMPREF1321_0554 [Capnocytophaga sp. oral taxon 412 str. F0487]VDG81206.1 Uncharacterised protein [Capnocytophaga ochracea]
MVKINNNKRRIKKALKEIENEIENKPTPIKINTTTSILRCKKHF